MIMIVDDAVRECVEAAIRSKGFKEAMSKPICFNAKLRKEKRFCQIGRACTVIFGVDLKAQNIWCGM